MFKFFLAWSFLFLAPLSNALDLKDLLLINEWPQNLIFSPGHKAIALIGMRVYFLKQASCYEGYMQDAKIELDRPLQLQANDVFSLNTKGIFMLAKSNLSKENVEDIRSILVRLKTREDFIQFNGLCSDQQINCCIPMHCDLSSDNCYYDKDLGVEPITVRNQYSI